MANRYRRHAAAAGHDALEVDHPALIARLREEYPDGWALSMKSNSLQALLPLCPPAPATRVLAWVKTFSSAYNRSIRPSYAWEPVVLVGGRPKDPRDMSAILVRDVLVTSPRQGLRPRQTTNPLGAKPVPFCRWVLDCLGYEPGDECDDIFPGTGMFGRVRAQGVLQLVESEPE
jgi:hypothetical protein